MSKKKSDGAGRPGTETIWCCRCSSCDFQVIYNNESPDEHKCTACDECLDELGAHQGELTLLLEALCMQPKRLEKEIRFWCKDKDTAVAISLMGVLDEIVEIHGYRKV